MDSLAQSGARWVALYARVSSEDQADRGTIDAQRDFLRNYVGLYTLDAAGEYADDAWQPDLLRSSSPSRLENHKCSPGSSLPGTPQPRRPLRPR